MAHELGHVWVFTHHPYLQTEKLANQIAMRVVTRDSLVNVYHKLWEHGGPEEISRAFSALPRSVSLQALGNKDNGRGPFVNVASVFAASAQSAADEMSASGFENRVGPILAKARGKHRK